MKINVVSLQIPIDAINKGISIAANSKTKQDAIDQERRNKYPIEDLEAIRSNAGATGAQVYLDYIADCDARKTAIIEQAQADLAAVYAEAVAFIDAETTPDGLDIIGENAGDYALLEHNLIETPEQLSRILAKHDNIAFRVAASRYANDLSRGWKGFDFFDKEKSIREYTEQIFDNLIRAAAYPTKPMFLQYVTMPHEYARIASAYGLADEFSASGGEKLEKTIYFLWPEEAE